MITRPFLFIAFSIVFSQAIAQSRISGLVLDAKTNEPLGYAHVQLMQSSNGTITNSLGQFSLVLSAEQQSETVGISYMGYENYLVPLTSVDLTKPLLIKMTPKAIQMNDLIVRSKQKPLIEEAVEAIPTNHDQEI